MSVVPVQTNENFIKACSDGDLDRYNQLVGQADVNYVSESGECQNLVEAAGNSSFQVTASSTLLLGSPSCSITR